MNDRFARWVFLSAGIVGIAELLPMYFMEGMLERIDPPAITHPELYYGFVGVALAWQVAFLIIARDPARYRALLPALILEKLLYPAGAFTLYAQGRVHASMALGGAALDLVWLALFVIALTRLGAAAGGAQAASAR